VTGAEKGRIYTYRLRGCGRALLWDDDRGLGMGLGTPTAVAAETGFPRAAALYFARLNSWRYWAARWNRTATSSTGMPSPDGSAIVLHTQSGQTLRYVPGFVIDRPPEPWVAAVPGHPPFIGYVVQFPPHRES
jgi:hypothetical protein